MRKAFLQSGILLLPICVLMLWGCQNPATQLADDFEQLYALAENQENNCAFMGAQLTHYLNTHGERMALQMEQVGESSELDARKIYAAAQKLEDAVHSCNTNSGVISFRSRLSTMVLRSTKLRD